MNIVKSGRELRRNKMTKTEEKEMYEKFKSMNLSDIEHMNACNNLSQLEKEYLYKNGFLEPHIW